MIPKLKKFIMDYKKKFGGKVVYINCTRWNKERLAKNLVELYKDPKCTYYTEDTTGFDEKFYGLKPEKGDVIFTKNTYDAFSNPKLDKFLKKNKIKYLIITGVFSDGCVESTIQNGFSRGYNFVILKDLVETTDVRIRQDLQKLLMGYTWPVMFGKTINSKELFR
jgi:nicotinamidase-related amidase